MKNLIGQEANFLQVSLLVECGADPEAKAQKRDICNGEYLTCHQLAREVGFAKYEQVKTDALTALVKVNTEKEKPIPNNVQALY